jgi:dTDP-4-dehydrorhamnose reductase
MILIIGAQGQLGKNLKIIFKNSRVFSKRKINIEHYNKTYNILKRLKPKYVFNCAAYQNVINCELNPNKAFSVNTNAVLNLAKISSILNFKLIHFSTDYVFDGNKNRPYVESDFENPINIYGLSKYYGEKLIKLYSKNFLIIRLTSLYSEFPCRAKKGMNFIDKMIDLQKKKKNITVNNLRISPTYTYDAAIQVKKIYKKINNQIIHLASEGSTTWFEFAKFIFKHLEINKKIKKIKSFDNDQVKRPKYTALKNEYLNKKKLNIMPNWKVAVKRYLRKKYLIL